MNLLLLSIIFVSVVDVHGQAVTTVATTTTTVSVVIAPPVAPLPATHQYACLNNTAATIPWTLNDQWCFLACQRGGLSKDEKSLANAETACQGLSANAHLAYTTSAAAWTAFKSYSGAVTTTTGQISYYAVNNEMWFGCDKSTGSFKWTNGAALSYTPSMGWPTGGNTYCYVNASANMQWQTDSSTNNNRLYICMLDAVPVIEASELTLTANAAVPISTSLAIFVPSFWGMDASTVYQYNYGDGTSASQTNVSATSKTYTTSGTFTITLKVSNAVSGSYTVTRNVTVMEPCVIASMTIPAAVVGSPSTITITLNSGTDCTVTVNLGDASSVQTVGPYAGDISKCVNTDPRCPTSGIWTITLSYTYALANTYTVNALAKDTFTNSSKTATAYVQETITGFAITSPLVYNYYSYAQTVTVAFGAITGTQMNVTSSVETTTVLTVAWNAPTRTGTVTISPGILSGPGAKIVTVTASNQVTAAITVSYSFTVEYKFINFKYSPNPAGAVISKPSPIAFTWLNASNFNYTIDPGDGQAVVNGLELSTVIANYSTNISYTSLMYTTAGSYTLTLSVANHIDSAIYKINMTVQVPVCSSCITLVIDYVSKMVTPTTPVPATFNILYDSTTSPYPTDAVYDFNFGDPGGTLSNQLFLNQDNQTQTNTYNTFGIYPITLTIRNLISSVTLYDTVYIVVALAGVQFNMTRLQPHVSTEKHSFYLLTGEVANFTVTLAAGTNYNVTIYWMDGSPNFSIYSVSSTLITTQFAYQKPGLYNTTMKISNAAMNETHLLPIPNAPLYVVVQDPIDCFSASVVGGNLIIIYYKDKAIGANVQLNLKTNTSCGIATGTDPRFDIGWGDGSSNSTGNLTPSASGINTNVNHIYTTTEIYNIIVTIWNEVSKYQTVIVVQVFEEVSTVGILPKYVDPTTQAQLNATQIGPALQTYYFPLEYTVIFYATKLFGSYEQYDWAFDDGYPTTTNSSFNRTFLTPGTYKLSLKVVNQPTSGNMAITVIIERSLSNLTITDNSPWPRHEKPYHNYHIELGSVPTDACYFFDFVDPDPKADCRYVMYGELATCQEFFKPIYDQILPCKTDHDKETSTQLENQLSNQSVVTIDMVHHYETLGRKNVTLRVKNHVDDKTFTILSYVTFGWCDFPKVIVRVLNRCLSIDACKCFQIVNNPLANNQCPPNDPVALQDGDRVGYMKDQIMVEADVSINCSSSAHIWFNWTMVEIAQNYTASFVLDQTQVLAKGGIPYQTYSSKTLVIPPKLLPSGRLQFTLTVSPSQEVDMDRSDDTFLYMQAANLIAAFQGNLSAVYVEQKPAITFDAWTESYDPDLPKDDKTDLKFEFYCRRSCESWPPSKSDHTYQDWSNYNHTACDTLDGYKFHGCFGATSTYPGPRPLDNPPSSSQWSFGDNAGTIVVDTTKMVANNWYTLMLVLNKWNRTRLAYREIMFYVSTHQVPIVYLQCVTNCQKGFATLTNTKSGRPYQRVNPTSRFSIEAVIPDFQMTAKYLYTWDLLSRPADKDNNSFDLNSLPVVNGSDWLYKASTGRNIRTMSIEANLWNASFLYAGFYWRLTFWVNSNTSGIGGQYFFEFFLNQPPPTTNAGCNQYPSPTNAQALTNNTGIHCVGYRDMQAGDLFYFVKQMDLFTSGFWLDIGSGKTSAMPGNVIFCNPAAGMASQNNTVQYKVRIVDSSGSYIETYFSGTVQPIAEYTYAVDNNPVYAILNHTENCIICQLEDYYTLFSKQQRTANVTAIARTFANMLNEKPSSGCLILECDNTTQNCSDETYATTLAPMEVPSDMVAPIKKALGPNWTTLSACQVDLQLRIQIRERIMNMFNGLQIPYYASFVQVISALYTVTFIPQENNINIMKAVEYCMREGISNIDGVDPQMSLILEADTREEAITQVIGVVSNMEKTANYHGKIWRDKLVQYYPDFTMEALVNEIKAAQASGNINFTVPTDIFQSNLTASLDAATLAELYMYQNNITLIHVILNNIYALKDNLTAYVQARKVMGESPSVLLTKNITAMYIKSPIKNMTSFAMTATDGCQFVAGDAKEMFGDMDAGEETVQSGVECAKNNPYLTDPTSKGLGGTVSLSFKNSQGQLPVGNLTKSIDAFVPRTINQSELVPTWNVTQPFTDTMFVYSLTIERHKGISFIVYEGYIDVPSDYNFTFNSSLHGSTETPSLTTTQLIVDPLNTTEPLETRFVIFFKFWKNFGADNLYDAYCIIPRWNESTFNETANPSLGDPRTCTISYTDLANNVPADVTKEEQNLNSASLFVNIQIIPDGYTIKDFGKTTKLSGFKRKYVPVEYTLFTIMSHCMYYDDDSKIWRIDGTDIGPNTTLTLTHCLVSHLTSFASGFSLPINDLNLQDSGFLHLAENPIAFVFCLCIFALYLILLVWCRRKDKEDTMKAGIAPLPDNDPLDKYLYQMVFYTGSRPNAGTTSKVFFQLTGDEAETDVRLACDMARNPFRRNGIDTFIMAVPKSIGKMTVLRIWHDNTGASPSWFLGRIQLLDVQTGEQFFFVVDNWLAVEEGDGQVERIVPVAGKGDLIEFNQLFFQKSEKNLFDGHIWFSVFRRPPRSSFTRVQRLTCCLSLIYCTMVANILFYGQAYSEHEAAIISIGPISFGWTALKIAIVSGLIVIPVNTLLVVLFRYSKPLQKKTPLKEYDEQMKFQEKQMKKEQVQKLKQIKEQQKQRAHDSIDPTMLHHRPEDEPPTSVEVTEPQNPPEPVVDRKKSLEPPKVVHIDTRVKKKKFLLPHWFIYIGYALCFITVGVAFWLIVQVAFGFGRPKALSWVIAMFVSLIQSIVFVQPIKIVIMAIIFSCLCKKPEKDEYEPEEIELLENEVYVHEMQTAAEMTNAEKRRQILNQLKRTRNALPPELQALQAAREKRMRELAMWGLVKEICFYAFFLYTLMIVAYGEKDLYGYYMVQNGQILFMNGYAAEDRTNMTKFDEITRPEEFFQWAESVLLPALFPEGAFHEKMKKDANERFVYDEKGSLAGTARFRQLRVKENSCKVAKTMQNLINHCRNAYSVLVEDKDSYHRKWIPVDPNITNNDQPDSHWTWQSMSQTKSTPTVASIGNYWGSGYVADFGFTADTAYSVLYDLVANDWLDAYTRAVFIEFALFYPSTNTFLVSNLVVEFLTTGGTVLGREMVPFRLNPFDGPNGIAIIIGLVCCLLFLLYFIFREVRNLIKQKKKYFLNFWNWLEVLVIALLITALVMFVYRMNIRKEAIDFFGKNPDSFNNFSAPLFWEQLFSWMIYIVLFIANVKFLRILRFNRRISSIVDTMRYGGKYMMAFTCTFFLIFMAFASAAFFLFNTEILDFSSFLNTVEALWVIMLNKFDWNDFNSVNRVLGPMFFIIFTLLLNFILVNMFLSIVSDSFSVVKSESQEKANDYELGNFLWFKMKQALCFGSSQVEPSDGPMYTEFQDTVTRDINDCEEKIEEMIFLLQEMFKHEKLDEAMKMDWRYANVNVEEGVVKRHVVISD